MDTVVGKRGSSSCLLVLTDRKSRLEVIRKLKSKTVKDVVETVKNIVREYPELIKTITSDNGSEFMNAEAIEELGIEYFYAHSYSSGERGSNENNNKLIRRYIKKGVDIGSISEEEIIRIEEWMNSYPRKLFNGKSSLEVYSKELTKYFS
ncbi:Transposase and inactivated derivatives, IS30 family [Fusobacterium necrophorum subsp. necrophorum]|nr:Transposase and inactivated derivatives, IS30 family [Fusobacterium necrophorum subsp. necrophorum]